MLTKDSRDANYVKVTHTHTRKKIKLCFLVNIGLQKQVHATLVDSF
jgi:hypothetical protein